MFYFYFESRTLVRKRRIVPFSIPFLISIKFVNFQQFPTVWLLASLRSYF